MRLNYKATPNQKGHSFYVERTNIPTYEDNWHFHDEYELMYIIKGKGVRIIGDNLSEFNEPELVLIGAKLPHLWKNEYNNSEDSQVDVVKIKFNEVFKGIDMFSISEFNPIKQLLIKSKQGLSFGRETRNKVHTLLCNISTSKGAMRLVKLFEILLELSKSNDVEIISSPEFNLPTSIEEENRLNKLISYISKNYTMPITLEEMADKAAMTPNSLCRFFKTRTNKTVFQFVNEYRIGKASQMLINGNYSISQICFDSGFNSPTSFNRVFKSIKKVTPREFKRKYELLRVSA